MVQTVKAEFCETVPESLGDSTLYVSVKYSVAIHKCMCGCGNRVVTPIHEDGWALVWYGRAVTLIPSIGCEQLPCRSHYFIAKSSVVWVRGSGRVSVARRLMRQAAGALRWLGRARRGPAPGDG